MPRIEPVRYEDAPAETRAAHDDHQRIGRITNMKRTLLHSLPAFHALMEWYPLRDAVRPFLGDRLTTLFAHAISAETDCLICSTFFRRILIDSGENPDQLTLDERDQGRGRLRPLSSRPIPMRSPYAMYAKLYTRYFTPEQIVLLTTFGAIMYATNLFNNALRVDLDGYLEPYRRSDATEPGTGAADGASSLGGVALRYRCGARPGPRLGARPCPRGRQHRRARCGAANVLSGLAMGSSARTSTRSPPSAAPLGVECRTFVATSGTTRP